MNVTAQTLVTPNNIVKATNGSLLLQGTNASGVATQSVSITNVGYVTARGYSAGSDGFNTGGATNTGTLRVSGGSSTSGINNNNGGITNAGLISQVTDGLVNASSKQAVNGSQLHATNTLVSTKVSQTDFDNLAYSASINTNDITDLQNTKADQTYVVDEVLRLDNRIDANSTEINNLQNTKADKTQVATDIAQAKNEAIASSNLYTDSKVANETKRAIAAESALNDKIDLNAETAKLYTDSSIQASETKLNKRIDALELKIDNRFNSVMSYVGNEFNAVNNRIEGLGAATVALSAAATSQVYNASKPTNLNIGTGVYGKATAIAVGMSHYFNQNTKVSVNWAAGSNTKNLVGIGCGISF